MPRVKYMCLLCRTSFVVPTENGFDSVILHPEVNEDGEYVDALFEPPERGREEMNRRYLVSQEQYMKKEIKMNEYEKSDND